MDCSFNSNKLFLNEYTKNTTIHTIGFDDDVMESLEPLYLRKIYLVMKEKNIIEKAIISKQSTAMPYTVTTKSKLLPKKVIGSTAKMIYKDIVAELIHGTQTHFIVLRNKEAANTARAQFEVFWKLAKKNSKSTIIKKQ